MPHPSRTVKANRRQGPHGPSQASQASQCQVFQDFADLELLTFTSSLSTPWFLSDMDSRAKPHTIQGVNLISRLHFGPTPVSAHLKAENVSERLPENGLEEAPLLLPEPSPMSTILPWRVFRIRRQCRNH